MKENKFSIRSRFKSFVYAFNGLKILFREEHNSRIHLLMAVLVIVAGFFFQISSLEWLAVIFAIGLVFVLEIVNSSIENLADFVSPGKNEMIKKVKDLSAAAVLVAGIAALAVGVIVFLPKVMNSIDYWVEMNRQ